MKNIIFIAPPAAGKGTQSYLLVEKYAYKHISTGDLLREEISKGTSLGIELSEIMNSGNLISDELVTRLLEEELITNDGPFIFDGYPRNINQAIMLDELLTKLNKNNYIVIYLDVSEDEAIKRATGRLICQSCSRSYHKYALEVKPIIDNMCDDCDIELINRDDDTEETYVVRYQNYINNISALLTFYENKKVLYVVENPVIPTKTFKEIEGVIK